MTREDFKSDEEWHTFIYELGRQYGFRQGLIAGIQTIIDSPDGSRPGSLSQFLIDKAKAAL